MESSASPPSAPAAPPSPWAGFHPAVRAWFERTHGDPSECQALGWPAIQAGRHTLIAAPTGSGKTLAAFLAAIDGLVRQGLQGRLPDETQVLYISPLKALSNDIQRNLQEPLRGVSDELRVRGLPAVPIRTLVRTGDTPASERAAMTRRPPHILVTTPESLFILLTSRKGRQMLATVRTVIVDEIHSLVESKRGAHLSLSLERLEHLVRRGPGLAPPSMQAPAAASATEAAESGAAPSEEPQFPFMVPSPRGGEGGGADAHGPIRGDEGGARRDRPAAGTGVRGDGESEASLLRIGLSATQNPIGEVARFLVGGFAGAATSRACTIVDTGHRRKMDLGIELPGSPLQAVMAMEVWGEVYGRLVDLIGAHRTTLIFVNTRRMSERVARALSERLGPDQVTSHHGSLSREQRLQAEQRLKAGELRALVATASLELGIDIGSIDLVCQLGSVRSISTFIQRAGRSGHQRRAIPKARLFPLTRDELVEAAALFDAVRRGELDRLSAPQAPLDLLAQQLVAMAAVEEWNLDDLFATVRRSYSFRELTREDFDAVVQMLGWGFAGSRGRFGAYLHVDAVNRRVRARRGAQLAAVTNGGAIPDNADFDVVVDATDGLVGTVNEDFAVESMAGDIFQLGNASWRIVRVESGKVRVEDAKGQPPTIPFWLGEAPGRSAALSAAVARLRGDVDRVLSTGEVPAATPAGPEPAASLLPPALPGASPLAAGAAVPSPVERGLVDSRAERTVAQVTVPLSTGEGQPCAAGRGEAGRLGAQLPLPGAPGEGGDGPPAPRASAPLSGGSQAPHLVPAVTQNGAAGYSRKRSDLRPLMAWLTGVMALEDRAAVQLAEYLAGGWAALGVLPTQDTLVIERFFDEVGGMQMIVHAPFGSRINRAWGLALRKRFCRQFNFELQAAATEDAVLLSLGPTHSFPLQEVYRYLRTASVRDVLVQALLAAPMFETRWRHNANRSLAVLRRHGGRKVAPAIQRMRAADLLTVVFPDQVACAENLTGPRQVPDHPLVKQTVRDCLEEVMDIAGLEALLRRIERGDLRLEVRDLTAPSPLAMEILNARPYAFLDDAPLEERRTQAVMQRRWLDPETAGTLGALDPEAIALVRREAWPDVSSADELHDALMTVGALTETEGLLGERAPLRDQAAGAAPAPFPDGGWSAHLTLLQGDGRACRLLLRRDGGEYALWAATEWRALWRLIHPDARFDPAPEPPPGVALQAGNRDEALLMAVRARLLASGPVTAAELARDLGVPAADVEVALGAAEAQGLAMRGRFSPGGSVTEWCERGLLARIHRYTLSRLRREIEPVSCADYMRFLLRWHRAAPGFRREGEEGLLEALQQLEGFEAPAASWETELLPARVKSYDGEKLDRICLAGRAVWARLSAPLGVRRAGPVATTPIVLMQRAQMPLWWALARPARDAERQAAPAATPGDAPAIGPEAGDSGGTGLSSPALQALDWLAARGASFFSDIVTGTGLLPTQAELALGELVYLGLATADSFAGLRALLTPAARKAAVGPGKLWNGPMERAGRWSLLRPPGDVSPGQSGPAARPPGETSSLATLGTGSSRPPARSLSSIAARGSSSSPPGDEDAEGLAFTLLRRYGVVFRRALERERLAPAWGDLVRVLRRLEARGLIRGGHFVTGVTGEQFALPEAVTALRELRRSPPAGDLVAVSSADPLNLCGIVVGPRRIPALAGNRVLYRDGLPIAAREADRIVPLTPLSEGELWACRLALEGRAGLLRRPG